MFWQTDDDWAQEEWLGARSYVGRFRPTLGFSVQEAEHARYVSMVGGPASLDQGLERSLLDAGCRVERIAGRDRDETLQILADMAHHGQRFLSLNG